MSPGPILEITDHIGYTIMTVQPCPIDQPCIFITRAQWPAPLWQARAETGMVNEEEMTPPVAEAQWPALMWQARAATGIFMTPPTGCLVASPDEASPGRKKVCLSAR